MYLVLFGLLRLFRRQTGSLGPADLLVLLLIADAAQNGMAEGYKSITEGVLLVGTIMFWEYLLDWLGFRSKWMKQIIEHAPLLLIDHGRVLRKHLQQELMTIEELLAHLRQKGIADPADVKLCYLEGDGHISVVPFDKENEQPRQCEPRQPH